MPNCGLAYYGEPTFESQEAGAAYMAKWMAWVGGLGDALVNPGVPLGKAKTVNAAGVADDGRSNRLTGFSIVKAESMEAALDIAKSCRHVGHGSVDVAEAMDMQMA